MSFDKLRADAVDSAAYAVARGYQVAPNHAWTHAERDFWRQTYERAVAAWIAVDQTREERAAGDGRLALTDRIAS